MPKIQIEANELTDGRVRYVSLVPKGANRIPFRVTKSHSEDDMQLNLSTIFARKTDVAGIGGDIRPIVTKLVLPKSDTAGELEAQTKMVKALGFKTDDVEDGDTWRAFKQADSKVGEVAVKFDDALHVVVAHAKKGFMDLGVDINEGNSFAAQGFFPSTWNALDMLQAMIWDCMGDGTGSDDAAVAIEKVCDDFKGYMGTIVRAIPATAWKADQTLRTEAFKREFDTETRKHLAATGAAMDDGSYPIVNKDDLKNAIDTVGMGSKPEAEVKSHIVTRAHAIGAADQIPADWVSQKAEFDLAAIVKSVVEGKQIGPFLAALAKAASGEVAGYISSITGSSVDDIVTVLGRNDPGGKLPADPSMNESADYASGLGKPTDGTPLSPAPNELNTEEFLKSEGGKNLLAAFGQIVTQAIAPVQEAMQKMDGRLSTVETTATAAKELAQKSDEHLSTTLAGGASTGDPEPARRTVTVKKSGEIPLIDTAYMRV